MRYDGMMFSTPRCSVHVAWSGTSVLTFCISGSSGSVGHSHRITRATAGSSPCPLPSVAQDLTQASCPRSKGWRQWLSPQLPTLRQASPKNSPCLPHLPGVFAGWTIGRYMCWPKLLAAHAILALPSLELPSLPSWRLAPAAPVRSLASASSRGALEIARSTIHPWVGLASLGHHIWIGSSDGTKRAPRAWAIKKRFTCFSFSCFKFHTCFDMFCMERMHVCEMVCATERWQGQHCSHSHTRISLTRLTEEKVFQANILRGDSQPSKFCSHGIWWGRARFRRELPSPLHRKRMQSRQPRTVRVLAVESSCLGWERKETEPSRNHPKSPKSKMLGFRDFWKCPIEIRAQFLKGAKVNHWANWCGVLGKNTNKAAFLLWKLFLEVWWQTEMTHACLLCLQKNVHLAFLSCFPHHSSVWRTKFRGSAPTSADK